MDNTWLPTDVNVAFTVVFGVILAVHLGHFAAVTGHARWWHATHLLMALGMLDMYWPTDRMPVGAAAGQVVFAVAAGVALLISLDGVRRGAFPWLWVIATVDLAAMLYMFVMMSTSWTWLTLALSGWLLVETAGWANGRLADEAQHESLVHEPASHEPRPAPAQDASTGGLATSTRLLPQAVVVRQRAVHARSVRISLAVMNLGMVYMFLAMQFGTAAMTMAPGGTPPGMPGM